MPICFPNVGRQNGLATFGILQDMQWSVVGTSESGPLGLDPAPEVTLYTHSDEYSLSKWPHHWDATYTVTALHAT